MITPTHQAEGQFAEHGSPASERETPSRQRTSKTAAAGRVRLDLTRYINDNRIPPSLLVWLS